MFVINETFHGNVTQLGECWPCLHEALGSDPSTAETGCVRNQLGLQCLAGRGGSEIQGHCSGWD